MRPAQGGMTLTELLVAVSLLSIVMAGGIRAFARASASQRDAATTQHLHERAQYVFATLEPELQMAGYFAAVHSPSAIAAEDIPPPAAQCGEDLVRRIDRPVEALPAWPLPCAPRNGGAVADSQVLVIRRAASHLAAAPQAGRAQWFSDAAAPFRNRLHWLGDAHWVPAEAAAGRELRDLLVRLYYVARVADGDSSTAALRVKSLTSIAGTPAFIDTEVMPGVESLQVEFIPDAEAPQAARVALRLRAAASISGTRSERVQDVARVFSLRNVAW